ncbi:MULTISPECIES: hypothetical protein [Sinorhizobium]|uniref:hypothetical protein n=1 Tax=Sinorhizobium TaxID=28105 RepID=UPI000FDCA824|nr:MULTISPECIES: hypothetical protein [Sinorhizobium]RVG59987.1 hypothetical protein CN222_26795 [Sinorhizobium meliloti]RVM01647.1 hypothetical protein CN134_36360 [Sinorhizobium meliloti]RVO19410.1 hypothetical protein CN098_36465 [Sinorhizobium meliloti]RVO50455.1 hypothetical protein CN092_26555 [Sinorhizobium meliloti]RVO74415.1 hypothetical protein CN084_22535 [Sinorhizobium medicae]
MTESDLIREEIAELEAQIFRIKGSMNRADNGVKLQKLAVITRLRDRCNKSLAALEKRGAAK